MAERVLPENLSGEEIRIAMMDKVMSRLAQDIHLSDTKSYDHFSYKISIHAELHDIGRIVTVDVTEANTLVETKEEGAMLDAFDVELAGEQADPNTMRQETGQAIPVLSKDADGKPTIRKVKYGRPKK